MKRMRITLIVVMVSVTWNLFADTVTAQPCADWIAKVVSIQGTVFAQRSGQSQQEAVKLNDTFSAGDMLIVGRRSRVAVRLCNDAVLRLDQYTSLAFNGIEKERTSLLELIKGAVHFFSRTPKSLKVATPFVNGTVEGTEFLVRVETDQTFMSIFDGRVLAENDVGSELLASGESATAQKGRPPEKRIVVSPRDAVQWAIYYPPVIDFRASDFRGDSGWETDIRQSIELYWKGEWEKAFSAIEKTPEGIRDPRFFTYRAGLLLTVGRVDEAVPDIGAALKLDPKHSRALALQSVIALVSNEKDKAFALAKTAADQDPGSSPARVALAYAQQARFDLKGALGTLEEAAGLDPENALIRARLSELWLSMGNLDKALAEAKKAVDLNPNLERTQTVLGFAYLTQIKTKASREAFEKAILLDQSAPLPRLGMGLAIIRDGELKQGREEIEIAAALDPNSSLIRSYLGKAYYEEKRDPLDQRQFDIAKELDPKDPTPYFYDAIRKQSVNRPVEALKDLQKSITLNDNRAVYRSKLMLDQDLAARSASLGRIYRDLGFEQLALVEGWKSVNTDPSNYSAHRFLADTYSALPRHEIARVSELLQSQLLQPININPIQPSLAESDSLILSGAGPSDPAFNEFNPLFNRNRLALQTNVVAGVNDTVGDDFVLSGVKDRFSISAGQNYYKTDGFRENNDLERQVYNVFAQASITPKTSIQAEYRYTDEEKGDLPLRFDPTNFLSQERQEIEKKIFRGGIHHSFRPGSDLIASVIYEDSEARWSPVPIFELASEREAYIAEVQYLQRIAKFDFVFGGGYFDSELTDRTKFFQIPQPVSEQDTSHGNVYLYTNINYPKNFCWTIGGSADFIEESIVDTDQFNPKFGVRWNPLSETTIRAAGFRVLKRTLISDQTIEPTQVAGFNQFFDDPGGTESWRYGVGLDHKLWNSMFVGAELSKRELDRPIRDTTQGGIVRHVEDDETLWRAYFFWTPHDWFSFGAEYQYEKFDRDSAFPGGDDVAELETHRFPFKFNFFHPLGLIAKLCVTYVDQNGKYGNTRDGSIAPGDDQFVVLDASIGYRLPKRFGVISIEAKNLLDEGFNFQDTDPANPDIYPERYIIGKITLSF